MSLIIFGYFNLLLISFLSATVLPLSSEILLSLMLLSKNYQALLLFIFVSVGNISGSIFNWYIGSKFLIFKDKKWFPLSSLQLEKSQKYFNKYGSWSILLAWLPIIGDPITILAGALKIKFFKFLVLVSISKLTRYLFLIYLFN